LIKILKYEILITMPDENKTKKWKDGRMMSNFVRNKEDND